MSQAAVQHLQLFGLSDLKTPADTAEGCASPSHDEVHVLRIFEDENFSGGRSVGCIYRLYLGVSLSSKALKTLRSPYIDMDGNELDLGFVPYRYLDHRLLTAYGIRSDHFWTTMQEGVEFLTRPDAAGGTDPSNDPKKGKKGKGRSNAEEKPSAETQIGGLNNLTEAERAIVDKGTAHYKSISSRLKAALTTEQQKSRFHWLSTGQWHKKCTKADKDAIFKAEGAGCCICGSQEHNMFKRDASKKQVCPHHAIVIKSWQRDPQRDGNKVAAPATN